MPWHQIWGPPEVESESSEGANSSRRRLLQGVVMNSDSVTDSTSNDQSEGGVVFSGRRSLESSPIRRGAPPEPLPEVPSEDCPADQFYASESEGSDAWSGAEGEEESAQDEVAAEQATLTNGSWSAGAAMHAQGQCRPCHYVSTKTGCMNGADCTFCHLAHPKRVRPRPCKSKRAKCKRLVGVLDVMLAADPASFQDTVERLSKQGGYLRTVVKSKVKTLRTEGAGAGMSSLDMLHAARECEAVSGLGRIPL